MIVFEFLGGVSGSGVSIASRVDLCLPCTVFHVASSIAAGFLLFSSESSSTSMRSVSSYTRRAFLGSVVSTPRE